MDLILRRRQLLVMQNTVQPPQGYRFIAYARSISSGAHVELPFGFDKTDTVETYAAIDHVSNGDKFLFAPRTWNTNQNRFALVGGYLFNAFGVGYGRVSTRSTSFSPAYRDDTFHLWTYANKTFSIRDIDYNKDVSDIDFGSETNNIFMFYGYNSNTSGKIAYYKHKKADGTTYSILPIQNKTTGEVEMYDTVSKTIMPRTGILYAPED